MKDKTMLTIASLVIGVTTSILILVWFDWRTLVVLLLFGWSLNLGNEARNL